MDLPRSQWSYSSLELKTIISKLEKQLNGVNLALDRVLGYQLDPTLIAPLRSLSLNYEYDLQFYRNHPLARTI